MSMDVCAIVVNWDTADLLDACLTSLQAHGADHLAGVIVVDNGSEDGSADLVRRAWPDVELIANDDNLGYTRANNQAIVRSRHEHLLLINADAMLQPGCLPVLRARMDADPRAAVVGPRLVYADGSWQRWTAGKAPSLRSAMSYFLLLDRLERFAGDSVYLARDVTAPFRPDWVSSACMLVRRDALDGVGLLDERYFCYMDDVDLCQRVRDAGWTVWYEPDAVATHLMGQATVRRTGAASPAALRNFNDYFTRRHGTAAGATLRAVEVAGFTARAAAYTVASAFRSDPASRSQARAHLRNARVSLRRGPA